MAVGRRGFIRVLGGGAAIVAAGGVGLARCDRMPAEAVAAWNGPPARESDPRRRALSYAILAPNPHNIQPWLVDLGEPGVVTLYVDRTRLLPETDPYARQILIGHGTFLELLDLAAAAEGRRVAIELFPDGAFGGDAVDQRPVARIRFAADPGRSVDPLFAQIPHRRSNKEPYDPQRPLEPAHVAALVGSFGDPRLALRLTTAADLVARLRGIADRAMTIEMQTPRTLRESIDLTRVGAAEIAANPDGIDLHGPFFWWLRTLGLFTREKAATPGTFAYQGGLDYTKGWMRSAVAFGWIVSPDNSRAAQVQVGRAYARLNLKATELGVAMHPLSQALQEYAEMAPERAAFNAAIGLPVGHTPQMFFRLGYADRPGPSPRRGLDAMVTA